MARLRSTVLFNVPLVIEANVVWKHVHFLPSNGRIVVVRLCDFLNLWFVGRNNQVAIHADVQTWNGRVIGALGGGVTVKALHLVLASVKFMRKCDGLIGSVAFVVSDRAPLATRQVRQSETCEHDKKRGAQIASERIFCLIFWMIFWMSCRHVCLPSALRSSQTTFQR